MAKNLTIFIGHHKVGSTSLQAHFSVNYHRYRRAGILYPFVEAQGIEVALRGQDNSRQANEINVREPHNALAFRLLGEKKNNHSPPFHPHLPHSHQMFRLMNAQINAINPKVIVLVSEVMSNFAECGSELVERISANFNAENVSIYCVLRRPDEYLESWYGQRLKFKHKMKPISKDGLYDLKDTIHFNYVDLLKPWISVFGRENVFLRYYPATLRKGGSVDTFLDFLKERNRVEIPGNVERLPNFNTSIHPALYECVRRLILEDKPNFHVNRLIFKITNSNRLRKLLPAKNKTEVLGAEVRQKIYDAFLPQKEWFDANFPEEQLFSDLAEILEMRSEHLFVDADFPRPCREILGEWLSR